MSSRITVLTVRGEHSHPVEVQLVPGRTLIVGRDPGADLVIDDDRVSRRHLAVSLDERGDVALEDLGSTNGSFLGGERLTRARVKPGARVVVGATVVNLEERERPPEEQPARVPLPRKNTLDCEPWLVGRLDEIPLFVLLQLLGSMRKSGVLEVRSKRLGRVHLSAGRVEYASIEGLAAGQAEKAIYRMLSWKEGRFELRPEEPSPFPGALELGTEELLLEGHRQLDELGRLEAALPAPQQRVRRLPSASQEGLDTFERQLASLAARAPSFGELLDLCPTTDLEASQIVLSLLSRGILSLD